MKMLKAERQDKILEILSLENKIIASELSVRLEVSEDTIRRKKRFVWPKRAQN